MNYVKTVTEDPSAYQWYGSYLASLFNKTGLIEYTGFATGGINYYKVKIDDIPISLIYTDSDRSIFIGHSSEVGTDYYTAAKIPIMSSGRPTGFLRYIKLKHGIYLYGLTNESITDYNMHIVIVGDKNIGYAFCSYGSYANRLYDSGILLCSTNDELKKMTLGTMDQVLDSTDVMRSVLLPYTFNVPKDAPLFSEFATRCPNAQVVSTLPCGAVFELNGVPYVKLQSDMIFEIETEEPTPPQPIIQPQLADFVSQSNCTLSIVEDGLRMATNQFGSNSMAITDKSYDLTDANNLHIDFYRTEILTSGYPHIFIKILNDDGTLVGLLESTSYNQINVPYSIDLDISQYTGSYKIRFEFITSTNIMTSISLE